jgi:hypothetical protein
LTLIRSLALSLALLVPLQAMAALAAGVCMSMGHHESTAADHEHANDAHDHGEQAPAAESSDDGNGAHCGPCAACCASASIASAVAISVHARPSHPTYLVTQYPPPGVQPDALYRPPLAL